MNLAVDTCNDDDNVGLSCLARVTHSCAKAWQAGTCVSALSALYVYSVHKLMQCTSTWAVSLQVPVVVLAVCRLHELPWLFQQPYCSRVSGAGCVAPAIVECILALHCTVDCVGRLGCTVDCVGRLGCRSTIGRKANKAFCVSQTAQDGLGDLFECCLVILLLSGWLFPKSAGAGACRYCHWDCDDGSGQQSFCCVRCCSAVYQSRPRQVRGCS